MFEALLREGILGRAVGKGLLEVGVHDLRVHTDDRHRTVDDVPYGGGPGMVLKPEPFFRAVAMIRERYGAPDAVVLLSPQGRVFRHEVALQMSRLEHVVLLCGRYEGVDERVRQHVATDEVSIGDYVLSGGEVPAAAVFDAVARLVPGVVGDTRSLDDESFVRGLLEGPHYTRPAMVGTHGVPDVLLSGHHEEIRRWRQREALRRTLERRPDLLEQVALDEEAGAMLDELKTGYERQATRERSDECD